MNVTERFYECDNILTFHACSCVCVCVCVRVWVQGTHFHQQQSWHEQVVGHILSLHPRLTSLSLSVSTSPFSPSFLSVEHNAWIKERKGRIENRYLIYSAEFMKRKTTFLEIWLTAMNFCLQILYRLPNGKRREERGWQEMKGSDRTGNVKEEVGK